MEERNKGTLGVDFDLRLAAHCIADRGLFSDFDQFSPLLPFASASLFLSASVSVIHVPILVPIEPML